MVDVIAGKLGSDILLLDLNGLTIIADYFVIATADSDRQLNAISDELEVQLKTQQNQQPLAIEGTPTSGWILLDYGDVIIHVFSTSERENYQLESLWSGARPVVRIQ